MKVWKQWVWKIINILQPPASRFFFSSQIIIFFNLLLKPKDICLICDALLGTFFNAFVTLFSATLVSANGLLFIHKTITMYLYLFRYSKSYKTKFYSIYALFAFIEYKIEKNLPLCQHSNYSLSKVKKKDTWYMSSIY